MGELRVGLSAPEWRRYKVAVSLLLRPESGTEARSGPDRRYTRLPYLQQMFRSCQLFFSTPKTDG